MVPEFVTVAEQVASMSPGCANWGATGKLHVLTNVTVFTRSSEPAVIVLPVSVSVSLKNAPLPREKRPAARPITSSGKSILRILAVSY